MPVAFGCGSEYCHVLPVAVPVGVAAMPKATLPVAVAVPVAEPGQS